jgi:hypothetical protein
MQPQLREANRLLREGRWAPALQAYERLLARAPGLSDLLAPNLELASAWPGAHRPPPRRRRQ